MNNVEETINPEHQFLNNYLNFVNSSNLWNSTLEQALSLIVDFACAQINVVRAGIWRMDDNTNLKLIYGVDDGIKLPTICVPITAIPNYINALRSFRVIDAEDAATDLRTAEFAGDYLDSANIVSMLDATLRLEGESVGVICLEHKYSMRRWTTTEKQMLQNIADLLSQVITVYKARETERSYQTMFDLLPVAAFRLSNFPYLPIDFVSEGIATVSGYTAAEIMSGEVVWGELILPEDFKKIKEILSKGLSQEELLNYKIEYRIRRKDGKIAWVTSVNTHYEEKLSNKGSLLSGVLWDSTQDKEQAERLQKNQLEIRKITELLNKLSGPDFFQNSCDVMLRELGCELAAILYYNETDNVLSRLGFSQNESSSIIWNNYVEQRVFRLSDDENEPIFVDGRNIFEGESELKSVRSLCIVPFLNSEGVVFGKLILMSESFFKNASVVEAAAHLFSIRAATEIDRYLIESDSIEYQQKIEYQNDKLRRFSQFSTFLSKAKDVSELFFFYREMMGENDGRVKYLIKNQEIFKNTESPWDEENNWLIAKKIHRYVLDKFTFDDIYTLNIGHDLLQDCLTPDELWQLSQMKLYYFHAMPIQYEDTLYGIYYIWHDQFVPISEERLNFRFSLADMAAVGIHNILAFEKTKFQANHDSLTGLHNRYAMNTYIESVLSERQPLALFLLDLDGFKEVNDTLGHNMGDLLLKRVALAFNSLCTPNNVNVFRLGGDEFAFTLPSEDEREIDALGDKISEVLNQPFELQPSFSVRASGSIGISRYPLDANDIHALLRCADIAMYRAKSQRLNVLYYNREKDIYTAQRLLLASQLADAIERRQLELFYQPIISLTEKRVTGLEALMRWRHPELGLLRPDDFLALTETSSHFHSLSMSLLDQAIAMGEKLQQQGFNLNISFNLSPSNLINEHSFNEILNKIKQYDFSRNNFCFEITETVLLHDIPRVSSYLNKLSQAGAVIAIDDFGVGFSSFSHIKSLPISTIKIDRSFISDLAESQQSKVIVEAILQMAKQLNFDVVAEGVEDQKVLKHLEAMCCPYVQGYIFSEAMSADELVAWMKEVKLPL